DGDAVQRAEDRPAAVVDRAALQRHHTAEPILLGRKGCQLPHQTEVGHGDRAGPGEYRVVAAIERAAGLVGDVPTPTQLAGRGICAGAEALVGDVPPAVHLDAVNAPGVRSA